MPFLSNQLPYTQTRANTELDLYKKTIWGLGYHGTQFYIHCVWVLTASQAVGGQNTLGEWLWPGITRSRYSKDGLYEGGLSGGDRLRKNKLCELHGVQLFKRFSAKFGFLDLQVRTYFQNVIFIARKWCKICKYYVNNMGISCSTFQNEEKEYIWVR